MRQNAVLLTILFALIVTLSSVTYTFLQFYKLNKNQHNSNIFTKYSVITQIYRQHMQKNTSSVLLEANLAVYDLYPVTGEVEINRVFEAGTILKQEGFKTASNVFMLSKQQVVQQRTVQDIRATMLKSMGKIYFFIESWKGRLLLEDAKLKPYTPYNLLVAYITITGMIIISYILILIRIHPLRRLRARIKQYGKGDMTVSFRVKGYDEIALLANELENTRLNINELMESRTLFLRNIMHELKTPIAKGRITTEMVENPKHKARFKSIFLRLESLINEFALIEEVTTGFKDTELSDYRIVDLIDGAIDLAMIEHDPVTVDVNPGRKIKADFKLFSTAIKNMIDNAMKYSPDKKIRICTHDREIWFESRGEKLLHPISFYVEPFTKEHPARDSFGLGLYLVDAILKVHDMVLAYEHEDGVNRFIFEPLHVNNNFTRSKR
ncbi:MAG: two-component sensor histidine kinase [Helicobacteraceae bacterium 4484_230]|nr:MAG: two-component sensor histidine kinase [Helicobacteraceae bacterium 4484_230]